MQHSFNRKMKRQQCSEQVLTELKSISRQKITNTYSIVQAQAFPLALRHNLRRHFERHSQRVVNVLMFRCKQERHSWQCWCVELEGWSERDSSVSLISHCEVSQREATKSSHKIWMVWKGRREMTVVHRMLSSLPDCLSKISIMICRVYFILYKILRIHFPQNIKRYFNESSAFIYMLWC